MADTNSTAKQDDLPPGQLLEAEPAVSLRDYFAAKALAGLLVTWNPDRSSSRALALGEMGAAVAAYRLADAMLREREKDGQ